MPQRARRSERRVSTIPPSGHVADCAAAVTTGLEPALTDRQSVVLAIDTTPPYFVLRRVRRDGVEPPKPFGVWVTATWARQCPADACWILL
jgi:hypothetical protein